MNLGQPQFCAFRRKPDWPPALNMFVRESRRPQTPSVEFAQGRPCRYMFSDAKLHFPPVMPVTYPCDVECCRCTAINVA